MATTNTLLYEHSNEGLGTRTMNWLAEEAERRTNFVQPQISTVNMLIVAWDFLRGIEQVPL